MEDLYVVFVDSSEDDWIDGWDDSAHVGTREQCDKNAAEWLSDDTTSVYLAKLTVEGMAGTKPRKVEWEPVG